MKNLWTKKNPWMSMWLSGANAVTGKARNLGLAEANRQRALALRQMTRFWTGARQIEAKSKKRP